MSANLNPLVCAPLLPLREQWRSAQRSREIAAARAPDDADPDEYLACAAYQQRWMQPWHTVRTRALEDFRYFEGGLISFGDNCAGQSRPQ